MSKPVIMSVDDDPEVLNAIERDLRGHFSSEYRFVKARSGAEGLEVAQQLKQRGVAVALFLVDQRMPEMTGTELLGQAGKLHPDACKVLLTAYADTEAAISSINEVGLDHYLLKPWEPPDQKLYPVLDDLLNSWKARVRFPYEGIRVIGARWSAASYAVKDFLSRNQVPYQWIDVVNDPSIRAVLDSLVGDDKRLPVVLFPDRDLVVAPTKVELAKLRGIRSQALLAILRHGDRWRGAGRPCSIRVRRVRGAEYPVGRAGRRRRAGRDQLPHRKLPWPLPRAYRERTLRAAPSCKPRGWALRFWRRRKSYRSAGKTPTASSP